MSTDQPIAEPTLRPIWTPEDAAQTARDAAKHVAVPGMLIADLRSPIYSDPILGLLENPAPTSPPRGRHQEPVRTGLRPRRALRIGRLLLATAAIVLVLTVGALWVTR